jgi:predicted DNA-binding protein (UPF0251 family)
MKEISLDETLCKRSGSTFNPAVVKSRTGRQRKIQDTDTIATIRRMKAGGASPRDIAQLLGVSNATVYRYLNQYDLQTGDDKVALIDDLHNLRKQIDHPPCRVCHWLTNQDQESQDETDSWIRDGLSRKTLFRALKANGLPVSETTFRHHAHECVLKDRDRSAR